MLKSIKEEPLTPIGPEINGQTSIHPDRPASSASALPATSFPTEIPPSKPKRSRISAPKTRYGCRTCKRRHVKCDERRPECRQCDRLGIVCSGYSFMTPKLLLAGQRPQTTLIKADTPKEASMGGAWGPNPEPSVQQIPLDKKEKEKKRRKILEMMEKTAVLSGGILPDVGHRLFVRPEEKQYFDHYRDVTSKQMSGWFQHDIWGFVMLQAAHDQKFVRHALVAIGAMGKSVECSQSGSLDGFVKDKAAAADHRHFALRQYSLAVRQIQATIAEARSKNQDNIRDIVLSCLLTACFEGFFNNTKEISLQIAHVNKILEEWCQKRTPCSTWKKGLTSPAPHIVEDELFVAMTNMYIKTMYNLDFRLLPSHFEVALIGNSTIADMPSVFSSVHEARPYFSLIARRALYFLKVAIQGKKNEEMQNDLAVAKDSDNGIVSTVFKKYYHEVFLWYSAFHPLLEIIRKDKNHKEYMTAMMLENCMKSAILRFAGGKAKDVEHDDISSFGNGCESYDDVNLVKLSYIKLNLRYDNEIISDKIAEIDIEVLASAPSDEDDFVVPDHIVRGVEYGFLTPLEGLGQRKGVGPWYGRQTMLWYDISRVDIKCQK